MHQPIDIHPNTLTETEVCPLTRPSDTLSPTGGEGMRQRDEKTFRAKSIYPRANRFAGRSSRRFSAVAGLRCHGRTMMLSLDLSIALMSGCAVGPNYSRPVVPTQTGWKESA